MSGPPALSVIIPTRNRASALTRLLERLGSLAPPDLSWETVVVDNGSTDGTERVVRAAGVRYVSEPRAGRSFALNAGVDATGGDFLVFVDDDVTPEPQWLAAMADAISRPGTTAAAGRILPAFEGGPPAWLPGDVPFPYRFDLGDEPLTAHTVFGANMAFRREAFTRYGRFRTDLGILPGNPLVGEETELCARLTRGGERIVYVPRAVVHHPVTPEQASPGYLLRWHYHYGRSLARRESPPPGTVRWRGVPRYLWREWATAAVTCWLSPSRAERLRRRLRARRLSGQIAEYRRIFLEPRQAPRPGLPTEGGEPR